MATLLEATQEALRKHLHEQIHEAIVDFDAAAILQSIKDDTLAKATEISQTLMGLETRWSNLELTHSGLLNKHLGPIVKDLVTNHLEPIVRAEVPRLLATKQVRDLILRVIKREVEDDVASLGGYNNSLKDTIEEMVTKEIAKVTESWISQQVDDDWLDPK
jgi:hypothetical protein